MKNVKEHRKDEIFIQYIHRIESLYQNYKDKYIKYDCYLKLLILHINIEYSPNVELIFLETCFHLKFINLINTNDKDHKLLFKKL